MKRRIIVRGVRYERLAEIIDGKIVCFEGAKQGIPQKDTEYVALYVGSPISGIQYVGVVEKVDRTPISVRFMLKDIIELKNPIKLEHQIRCFKYMKLAFMR